MRNQNRAKQVAHTKARSSEGDQLVGNSPKGIKSPSPRLRSYLGCIVPTALYPRGAMTMIQSFDQRSTGSFCTYVRTPGV